MIKAGTWRFYDSVALNETFIVVTNTTPSKIQEAFAAANTALSPTSPSTLFGVDPAGHRHRYTSVALKQKFEG